MLTLKTERVDGSNAARFDGAMRTALRDGDRALVKDLENLAYISSAGLGPDPGVQGAKGARRRAAAVRARRPAPGGPGDRRVRQVPGDPSVEGRRPGLPGPLTLAAPDRVRLPPMG